MTLAGITSNSQKTIFFKRTTVTWRYREVCDPSVCFSLICAMHNYNNYTYILLPTRQFNMETKDSTPAKYWICIRAYIINDMLR